MSNHLDNDDSRLKSRLDYLEDAYQHIIEVLNSAVDRGDFRAEHRRYKVPIDILRDAASKITRLAPFKSTGFWLVDESTSNLNLEYCNPFGSEEFMVSQFDHLTDEGIISLALINEKTVLAAGTDSRDRFMVQSLSTASRIRGIFLGRLESGHGLSDATIPMVMILCQSCASSLEAMELYSLLEEKNRTLHESEERYRMLSDVTMEGIVIHKSGMVRDTNNSLSRITGYSRDELIGSDIVDLIFHPEDRDMIRENISKEYASPYIVRGIRKNGDTFFAELEARDILVKGEELRVGAVRDITERKKAQDKVARMNHELKKIVAEKDKFFSIIAHDLKSPMSGLLTLSGMIARDARSWTMEEVSQAATSLHKSAEKLFDLLENLLQWARMQRGAIKFEPVALNLKSIVQTSLFHLITMAEQKEIAVDDHVLPEIMVMVDEPMINTVIRNILSNAFKFTPRGGRVEISAGKSSDMVEVVVQDSGVGMEEDVLNKVFSIGDKVSNPGTEGEPSTGLGLILCKEFVEKHGGRIWLESRPGNGTKVFFTLPLPHSE